MMAIGYVIVLLGAGLGVLLRHGGNIARLASARSWRIPVRYVCCERPWTAADGGDRRVFRTQGRRPSAIATVPHYRPPRRVHDLLAGNRPSLRTRPGCSGAHTRPSVRCSQDSRTVRGPRVVVTMLDGRWRMRTILLSWQLWALLSATFAALTAIIVIRIPEVRELSRIALTATRLTSRRAARLLPLTLLPIVIKSSSFDAFAASRHK